MRLDEVMAPEGIAYGEALIARGKAWGRVDAIRWGYPGDRVGAEVALAAAEQEVERTRTILRKSWGYEN